MIFRLAFLMLSCFGDFGETMRESKYIGVENSDVHLYKIRLF